MRSSYLTQANVKYSDEPKIDSAVRKLHLGVCLEAQSHPHTGKAQKQTGSDRLSTGTVQGVAGLSKFAGAKDGAKSRGSLQIGSCMKHAALSKKSTCDFKGAGRSGPFCHRLSLVHTGLGLNLFFDANASASLPRIHLCVLCIVSLQHCSTVSRSCCPLCAVYIYKRSLGCPSARGS